MKAALVLLALLSLALGVTVVIQFRQYGERLEAADSDYARWSNRWHQSQETLSVTEQGSAQMHTTLLMRETLLALTSNELARATNRLAESAGVVAEQQAEIKAAADELQKRDEQVIRLQAQVRTLERERDQLQTNLAKAGQELAEASRQRDALTAARTALDEKLTATRGQLRDAQADAQQRGRTVDALNLERELTLQQNEKLTAEVAALKTTTAKAKQWEDQVTRWQAQWNDLATVRTQFQKLQQANERAPAPPPAQH